MASDAADINAWPADWASLYDAMDLDRSRHLAFYCGLVTPGTRSLLDLGCGTGSITMEIAAKMPEGARIAGVDLSTRMIEIARDRAPQHEWVVGDLARPGVEGPFDLVVICFHTLQLLLDEADLAACFRSVAGLLAPGGRFAFDIYNPNRDWLAAVAEQGVEPFVTRSFTDAEGRAFDVMDRDSHYDPETRVLSGSWTLHEAGTGTRVPLEPIVQKVRQYFPEDIERNLAAAGMTVAERYGDLDLRPFEDGCKRQLYVCTLA